MPNSLPITSDQTDATQRNDLRGVVYALSGTLPGRGGRAPVTFRWATQTFSGAIGSHDLYLGPPQSIRRAAPFQLDEVAESPPVAIPVRNLPFAQSPSLVASISDDVYAWENAQATLRVGYLKPGETAADLAEADWTILVRDGFFGTPQDVNTDGFNLLLYPRGVKRSGALRQPLVRHGIDSVAFNADFEDDGKAWPIWLGKVDSYVPLPTRRTGERGFLQESVSAGATSITFRPISGKGTEGFTTGGGKQVLIHFTSPAYTVSTVSRDDQTGLVTLTLSSGLAADVPRGAFVQQNIGQFEWAFAGHKYAFKAGFLVSGELAWLLPDGRIVPVVDSNVWGFRVLESPAGTENAYANTPTIIRLVTTSGFTIPTFFEPLTGDPVSVTQQPTFSTTSEQQLTDKSNFPSGGSGTDENLVRDGNENTGASLAAGSQITSTFNSAPSPFMDDDTTASILYVIAQGEINFFAGATATLLGAIGPGASKGQYRFVQSVARDFNQTVRSAAPSAGGGGVVYEVWWEHDLSTTITIDRDDDVVVGGGGPSNVGAEMEFARLAIRPPSLVGNDLLNTVLSGQTVSGVEVTNPWQETDSFGPAGNRIAYPTAVMAGLQSMLLGPDGRLDTIDQTAYDAAHLRFTASGIRYGGVITDVIRSWSDLERQLAAQARSYFYYGPNGHQIVFAEDGDTLEALSPLQTFRLPGVPGANCLPSAGPLIERTSVSDIINQVVIRWDPDYTTRDTGMRRLASGLDQASIDAVGVRKRPGGDMQFWALSPYAGHTSFDASDMVSGHANFFAGRFSKGYLRFGFDTAWIAHGVDRGSLVRVVFSVGQGAFRTATCEVEEITTSPINAERFRIVARSVATPQKGFGAETWRELFIDTADTWVSRIEDPFDDWRTYWVVP